MEAAGVWACTSDAATSQVAAMTHRVNSEGIAGLGEMGIIESGAPRSRSSPASQGVRIVPDSVATRMDQTRYRPG